MYRMGNLAEYTVAEVAGCASARAESETRVERQQQGNEMTRSSSSYQSSLKHCI